MRNTFLMVVSSLSLMACVSSTRDWIETCHSDESQVNHFVDSGSDDASDASTEEGKSREYRKTFNKLDACTPLTFSADSIPSNFIFDPNCPPDIYFPQKWIPPWDKSPVMNND